MKVPLLLYTYNNKINIIKNSQIYTYDLPFNPYILYLDNSSLNTYKLIPSGEKVNIRIREYTSIDEANNASFKLDKLKTSHHYLKYNEQLFIDQEDYILQHANTDDLKILYFDIEVMSYGDGLFPRASSNPIAAIGCKFNDESIKIFDNYQDNSNKNTHDGLTDKILIDEFLNYIQKKDPDIIVGYNSRKFDITYIVERCKINNLDYNKLARFKSSIFNKNNEIVIKNRIHFDLYDHIIKDQTIMGVKTHKMKDIANWKKIPNVIELDEEEIKNTYKLYKENKPRLIKYLESDVNITSKLCKGYLNTSIALAEFIKVPLDSTINGYPSFIPKIICGRNFNKLGYVALDRNHERYNETSGKMFKTGFKYEGAIVASIKTGFFPKVWKVDYSGMYPSSIFSWNIGPDTTKIHEMKEYTGDFECKRINNVLWLNIPDKNFNKQIIISIDQNKEGFLKKYIKDLFVLRKELKEKQKEAEHNNNDALKEEYYARQWAIKITLNCIYGYLGQEFSSFGDMGSAIAVVGCCRWLNKYTQVLLGDNIISLDTDGFMTDKYVNVDELNNKIKHKIEDVFNIKDSSMKLELEEFDCGYFYRMKNYILKEKDKIILHGVSFKSSRHPKLYDISLMKLANDILENKGVISQKVLNDIKNLDNYKLSDFILRVKINKDPLTYDNPNAIQGILMDQVNNILEKSSELGDQIEYFVTLDPAAVPAVLKKLMVKKVKGFNYIISQLITSKNQLDMEYYSKEIDKVIKLFQGEEIEELENE